MSQRIRIIFSLSAALVVTAWWLDRQQMNVEDFDAWRRQLDYDFRGMPTSHNASLAALPEASMHPLRSDLELTVTRAGVELFGRSGPRKISEWIPDFKQRVPHPWQPSLAIEHNVEARDVAGILEAFQDNHINNVVLLFQGDEPQRPPVPSDLESLLPGSGLSEHQRRKLFWDRFERIVTRCGSELPNGHANPEDLPFILNDFIHELALKCAAARSDETRFLLWVARTEFIMPGARAVLVQLSAEGEGTQLQIDENAEWEQFASEFVRASRSGPIHLSTREHSSISR
jgi:hypothetical protein